MNWNWDALQGIGGILAAVVSIAAFYVAARSVAKAHARTQKQTNLNRIAEDALRSADQASRLSFEANTIAREANDLSVKSNEIAEQAVVSP